MKFVGIIAALALAAAPVVAPAQQQQQSDSNDQRTGAPEPGGVSQEGTLPAFSLGGIPAGAVVVGGVVILAGVIIGVIASEDSTVNTTN